MPQGEGTNVEDAETGTWWRLVADRAAASPDRVMMLDDLGRSLTFAEFRDRAETVAAALRSRGICPGATVSWQLPTCAEAVVLIAALARLNAVQNPILPILRDAEVGGIVAQVRPDLFIVPSELRGFDHAAMARRLLAGTTAQILVSDLPSNPAPHVLALPQAPSAGPAADHDRAATSWLYYSSGSTAEPKGIKHSDASIWASSQGIVHNLDLTGEDVFSMPFPITHIGGVAALTAQLRVGFTTLLCSAFDPIASSRFLAAGGVTVLTSALPFFRGYLAAQSAHGHGRLFPRLRFSMNGGAPMPPDVARQVTEQLGGDGVLSGWGLTECPIVTFASPADPDCAKLETNGRAAPGVTIRVVDPATGRDCPPGREGELRLKAPQMFSGYISEDLDATAFDDAGFLRTGDLGTVDTHGYVRVTGRIKDIVIRNAENVSTIEVENLLMAHPEIDDAAVIGLPDARTGERCCAVITRSAGAGQITLDDLAAYCKAHGLAAYKIPEQLEVVAALPRNAMGKVLKHELRRQFQANGGNNGRYLGN